jgi:hypothetical protein
MRLPEIDPELEIRAYLADRDGGAGARHRMLDANGSTPQLYAGAVAWSANQSRKLSAIASTSASGGRSLRSNIATWR